MRLWTPFFNKPDDAGGGGGGEQGGGDDGFTAESGSVAFTPAPSDTTAGLDETPATEEISASAEGVNEPPAADAGEAAATSPEASASAAAATPKVEKPAGQKKASKPSDRVAELKKEIDTLTHTKHQTKSEIERDEARAGALRAEVAALEARKLSTGAQAPTGVPGGQAAAGAPPATEDREPSAPKYRDFATDEEYETAFTKWQTDHSAWNRRQIEAIKADVTAGVESRFSRVDQDAQARVAQTTLATTLDKVRATKPDWAARTEAIKGLTSAWYDPKAHGPSTTPFLSDLSQSLLMQGREEGAELLHWLGEDPARAQRIADLRPTRPLRDALVYAPSVTPLLEFFASDEGAQQFEAMRSMHPIMVMQTIGALSSRLQPVPRGSGAAAHPITGASPSARPPAGTPGARGTAAPGSGASTPGGSFDDWMQAEDARELADRKRLYGVSA